MPATISVLSPLKHAVLAFFKHDLALRRQDGSVRLVLEDRIAFPAGKPPSRAEQVALKEKQALQQARTELAQLLDDDPALRSKLRHLAFVEHALEKKGWRGLYKVPLEVLQKGHEQLEGLVTNWSPTGLACLRSKMAVAVIDREHQDADDEPDAYRTAAVLDNPPVLAVQAIETAKASAEDEDAALRAAYAALGAAAPPLEGEDASASATSPTLPHPHASADEIRLRDLPA